MRFLFGQIIGVLIYFMSAVFCFCWLLSPIFLFSNLFALPFLCQQIANPHIFSKLIFVKFQNRSLSLRPIDFAFFFLGDERENASFNIMFFMFFSCHIFSFATLICCLLANFPPKLQVVKIVKISSDFYFKYTLI